MPPNQPTRQYKYEIALSFAREDRDYVARVAAALRAAGVRVFFQEYERAQLVGRDLTVALPEIYQASRHVVAFLSEHYARRGWTDLEFRSVRAGEMEDRQQKLIPARFDDTAIAGLLSTISYIDLRELTLEEFVELLLQRLAQADDDEVPAASSPNDDQQGSNDLLDALADPISEPEGFFFPVTLAIRRAVPNVGPSFTSEMTSTSESPISTPANIGVVDGQTRRAINVEVPQWREGVPDAEGDDSGLGVEISEREVFDALRRQASNASRGDFWVLLGEPGAGKSTLLDRWFLRWGSALAARPSTPRDRRAVPALVKLRELGTTDRGLNGDAFAERLWLIASEEAVRLPSRVRRALYESGGWRTRPLVWMLDGLDELQDDLAGRAMLRRFANLPGLVVLSCRTAIYQTLRPDASAYAARDREYEIKGLKVDEQRAFLAAILGDEARAAAIHTALSHHSALRPLAANPLMLSLLGQVPSPEQLPATRAAFYGYAAATMWQRKVGDEELYLRLTEHRDPTLAAVAESLGMEKVEGVLSNLIRVARESTDDPEHAATLVDWLARAGLVRIDRRRELFAFIHKTFQEYYLARSLEADGFLVALQKYWRDDRYEETLSLLAALIIEGRRYDEVEHGVRWLLTFAEGLATRSPTVTTVGKRAPAVPSVGGQLPASPPAIAPPPPVRAARQRPEIQWPSLRAALRLLARAGAPLLDVSFRSLLEALWQRLASTSEEFVLSVASDERVPPAVLLRLASARHSDVRWAVANNRSAPSAALETLAVDLDGLVRGAVASNPAAAPDLLFLLGSDEAVDVRRAVATNTESPALLLDRLAKDPRVCPAVASNPAAPPDLIERLAGDGTGATSFVEIDIRMALARNPSTPISVLSVLAGSPDDDVRRVVASSLRATPEILVGLMSDASDPTRREIASNPVAPPELLAQLATTNELDIRVNVASNPRASADTLIALAADAEPDVRVALVSNPSTPLSALEGMARDPDVMVRRALAANPALPAQILDRLVDDESLEVRMTLIDNPNTPLRGLERLTRDPEASVRRLLARSDSARPDVLARLANDGDRGVRRAVARHSLAPLPALTALAVDAEHDIRLDVATNPSTSPVLLSRLARDPEVAIRRAIAEDPRTPVQALSGLAQDKDANVREGVARHASAAESMLRQLALDVTATVRAAVAQNPVTPPDLLETLASDERADVRRGVAGNASTSNEILSLLCDDPVGAVRTVVARNEATPALVLIRLAEDESAAVRAAVARNPSLPPEAASILAADGVVGVQGALSENVSAHREVAALLESM